MGIEFWVLSGFSVALTAIAGVAGGAVAALLTFLCCVCIIFLVCLGLLTFFNHNDDMFYSIYPKWLLRRFLRDTPPMKIVAYKDTKSSNREKSILTIYPFRYSWANERKSYDFDLDNQDRQKVLKEYNKLCAKVEKTIQKDKIDFKVKTYTQNDIDMWEL